MSHFTRIQTQMVEKEYITQALSDLGYEWEAGDVQVRGFGAGRRKVEIKVKTGLFSNEIGFVKSGQAYEIIADWWGVRGMQRDKFRQELTQRYAYHAARAKLQVQGFDLVNEEVEKDGQIRLVLRRVRA